MITKYRFTRVALTMAVCSFMTFNAGVVNAQDDDAVAILKSMSDEIAGLNEFVITGDGYMDARLDAGQIIEHSMDVTMRMRRPDAMRITNSNAEGTNEIYYGGGVLTVYTQERNFYAQRELPDGVDAAAQFAINELGIDAPMLDFVSNDVAGHLLKDAESVEYLGLSLFRGMTYHHIGIRMADADLQLWVAAEGPPLPGKMAISSKWEGGSPRSVYFFSWDTAPGFAGKSFSFEPPAGATRIVFERDADK